MFNLFVVWCLTGVWHGANWTFICWGLFYFLLLVLEKLTGFDDRIKQGVHVSVPARIGRHLYVILAFMFGWVLFRSVDLFHAVDYYRSMFALAGNPIYDDLAYLYFIENKYFFLFAAIFSAPVANYCQERFGKTILWKVMYSTAFVLLFSVCTSYIAKGSYNPFIYFNF